MHELPESKARMPSSTKHTMPRSQPSNGGDRQIAAVNHSRHAAPANPNADGSHKVNEIQLRFASVSTLANTDGQSLSANQATTAVGIGNICDRLRELHRQRQDLHRSEKSMTLRIKAKCRRLCAGELKAAQILANSMFNGAQHEFAAEALIVSRPFIEARTLFEQERKRTEKAMAEDAAKLPVAAWVENVRGFGIGSLAAVIGETGDLSLYANPGKVWKRMGLAVINGERQRCKAGAAAMEHGYCPSRRAVMWNVGAAVFKHQSMRVDKETGKVLRPAGPYRLLYDERKEYELTRVESKGHAHNRAMRYMEKRLLRDLWRAWRDC